MIRRILVFAFLFLSIIDIPAQEDNEQKLVDMLLNGRFFEAKEFYDQAEKKGVFQSFCHLYYKFQMAGMQNRIDSAAVFLEQLLEKDGDDYSIENKHEYYDELQNLYVYKLQNYEKAISTCDEMLNFLKENPSGLDKETIDKWINYVKIRVKQNEKRKKYPTIKFSRNGLNNTIEIKDDNKALFFDATYNGNKTLRTLFDTGCSAFFLINEKTADSMGIRKVSVFETPIMFNGEESSVEEGLIDSVEIANFKFYNIPVYIQKLDPFSNAPDSVYDHNSEDKEEENYFFNATNLIMGYPMMFLIGKIMIDFEKNTLSFPDDTLVSAGNNKEPNFFVYPNALYSRLEINDIPFTAQVDFGYIPYDVRIHTSFYEKNKDKIPVKVLIEKETINIGQMHKIWFDISCEIPDCPVLKFNGKIIPNIEDERIRIYSLPDEPVVSGAYDGCIGYPFFKNLGKKILLDFKTMRIDVIE